VINIKTILGKNDFIESLRGKDATFILSMSTTKTCEIDGLTQAGLPGLIPLTPTLDAEFLTTGEVRSLIDIATTPTGVPTPALITRGVHLLKPFQSIYLNNLGIDTIPNIEHFQINNFNIKPSDSIADNANIDAFEIFEKGVDYGKSLQVDTEYIILAESVPAGTTTAYATAKALGYNVDGKFSSSFQSVPNEIKNKTIQQALNTISDQDDIFEILGKVSDNMLIFNAGFLLGSSYHNQKILLAGGTQMAAVLLIVDAMIKHMQGIYDSSNIALCTTSWIYNDSHSDIKSLLEMVGFNVNAYCTDFTFENASHPALKLYDQGEAKEGVGAGAALVYGALNGLKQNDLIVQIESLLG
jgi:uncharacterized protein (TIGR00303 family)